MFFARAIARNQRRFPMKRMFLVVMLAVSAVFSAAGAGEEELIADVVKQFNQALKDKNFDLAGKLVTPDSLTIVEAWKALPKAGSETLNIREKDGLSVVKMSPASMPITFSQLFLRKIDGSWKVDLLARKNRSDYDKVDPSFTRSSNLKQIGLGLAMYALDKGDLLPAEDGAAGLEALRKNQYLIDPRVYVSPLDSARKPAEKDAALTEANSSYVYFGGVELRKLRSPSKMPTAFEKPDTWQENTFYVLLADGHVEQWKGDYKNVAGLVEAIIARGGLDDLADSLRKKAAEADRRLQEEAKK